MHAITVKCGLQDPSGVPVVGVDTGNRKHIFFGDITKVDDDILVRSNDPWAYIISAHGRDIDEAVGRAQFTQKIVRVPDAVHVGPVSSLYKVAFNKLKAVGYL